MTVEQNSAFVARVEVNQIKQAKACEKRLANKRRLAGIEIVKDTTEEQLGELTVFLLDQQINKLRRLDKEVQLKSRLKSKKAKIEEILRALKRHQQMVEPGEVVGKELGLILGDVEMWEPEESEGPRDEDMDFKNEP